MFSLIFALPVNSEFSYAFYGKGPNYENVQAIHQGIDRHRRVRAPELQMTQEQIERLNEKHEILQQPMREQKPPIYRKEHRDREQDLRMIQEMREMELRMIREDSKKLHERRERAPETPIILYPPHLKRSPP